MELKEEARNAEAELSKWYVDAAARKDTKAEARILMG